MSFQSTDWDTDVLGDKMHGDIFKKKKRIRKEKVKLKAKVVKHVKSKINKDMSQKMQVNRKKPCDKITKTNDVIRSKKNMKNNLIASFKKITEMKKFNQRKTMKSNLKVGKFDDNEATKTRKKIRRSVNVKPSLNETVPKQVTGLNIANLKKQLASSLKAGTSEGSLRQRMLDKLNAARFRFLNEQLYTTEGAHARQLFQQDPDAFRAYHQGYRQQVALWPLNPLDKVIGALRQLPTEHVVVDFGCGDARLARSVEQCVHSFDLVANGPEVVACDMAHVPLAAGQAQVAVFCLSLMGTNLADYLLEANRVLVVGGLLKIAEVESRFAHLSPPQFVRSLRDFGFEDGGHDLSHDLFYFFDFTKQRHVRASKRLPKISLQPCLYKKR